MSRRVRKKKIARLVKRNEYWILAALVLIFIMTLVGLVYKFYREATELTPSNSGTYIEGAVGELAPLNPWFTVTNDVNRDIASLVFAGLLTYNPETKQIEENLATLETNNDATIYTVTLKDNIHWHDSTNDSPHLVTADDVLFTFKTIQEPEFPNPLLQQNFQGVEIEKIDDMTVRFKLEEPYSFFPSSLTLGLLPARAFKGIPVNKLDQTLSFGLEPIGCGPYAFIRNTPTELSTEITLERFEKSVGKHYLLKQIIFRIFPDYSSLLTDLHSLHGIRHVPRSDSGEAIIPSRFRATNYTLPQYVALFLNTQKPILNDNQLRLGLQLGINKQELIESINESVIIDTPLLEIDTSDWRYRFDLTAAQGAMYESNWHLPEKLRLQRLLEIRDANESGYLTLDPIALLTDGASLTLTGSYAQTESGWTINGLPIAPNPEKDETWIVHIPTQGTGSLQVGENIVRLENLQGRRVDTFYLYRTDDSSIFKKLQAEQAIVEQFLLSRDNAIPENEQITIADLALEENILKKRVLADPVGTRHNDAGESLTLTLVTSPSPPVYVRIAENVRLQLAKLGVEVEIVVPETANDFEQYLLNRDYDILLYGQSLLDNLDSYPYWHSSGIQTNSESQHEKRVDAYNLSQYRSLRADTLLEFIRVTTNEEERKESLNELRNILRDDVPAIFLYSPLYTYAHHNNVQGIEMNNLSIHSDRFLTLKYWYSKQKRIFKEGKSWWSFFPWLFSL